jgi:hypothetical protein
VDVIAIQNGHVFPEDGVPADLDALAAVYDAPDAETARPLEVKPAGDVGHAFGTELTAFSHVEFAVAEVDSHPIPEMGPIAQRDPVVSAAKVDLDSPAELKVRGKIEVQSGAGRQCLQAEPDDQSDPPPALHDFLGAKHV